MKLDSIAPDKYTFVIEDQVLPVNAGQYHMEKVGEHEQKLDVTRRHPNLDGTCDIYAIVEPGAQYLVHTPEKVLQVGIGAGGQVTSMEIHYHRHS